MKVDVNSPMYGIVGCAMNVYNELKSGYLESVYEMALEYELLQAGFSVSRQVHISVWYKGIELHRNFVADMVVNGSIIIELKAVSALRREHEAQLMSYLKATNLKVGLLVNFGHFRQLEWRVITR